MRIAVENLTIYKLCSQLQIDTNITPAVLLLRTHLFSRKCANNRTELSGSVAADAERWFGVWDRTKLGWIYLQTPQRRHRLSIRNYLCDHDHEYGVSESSYEVLEVFRLVGVDDNNDYGR